VLVVLAVALVVAGCGGVRAGSRSLRLRPLASVGSAARHYEDSLGWSIAYPSALHLEHARSPGFINLLVNEVTVANFPMRSPIRAGHTKTSAWMRVEAPRDRQGSFPANGIAFRVSRQEGGPAPDLELAESHFPLRLSTFHRSTNFGPTKPPALERVVVADGGTFTADAWIGAKASAGERATLERVIGSLSFPRLHAGETVGDFRVFGSASDYPVGSFTRIRVQHQPFYLVHAPGGWYAVGWTWQSITGGYKSRCRLHLDRASDQFFCTNMHARWDRVGRVLAKPKSALRGDPLNVTVAKVAWDGHVLVTAGIARFADAHYAHQLWPNTSRR